jgi:hypothetical protein
MTENDTQTDGNRMPKETPKAPKRTSGYRSAITSRPEARLDGNSLVGRRTRDLYRGLMKRMGAPDDIIVQTSVLAWAELVTASEVARARLLEGDTKGSTEVVRLENLTRRAAISVGLESAIGEAAPLTMADRLAALGYAPPSDDDDETDAEDVEGAA